MHSILVVDDNADSCHAFAKLLTNVGDRARCATSGEAALEYLHDHSPCLIILDEMMPGMDGMEVLRRIRADAGTAGIPVIMFSAISDPLFIEHAKLMGASDYWVKTMIDYSDLHQLVAPYVAGVLLN